MSNKILSLGLIRKCNTSYGHYILPVTTTKKDIYIDIQTANITNIRESKILTREIDNKLFFWRKQEAIDYKKMLSHYINKELTEDEYRKLIEQYKGI